MLSLRRLDHRFECLGQEGPRQGFVTLGVEPRCEESGHQGWHNGAADCSPVPGQSRRDLDHIYSTARRMGNVRTAYGVEEIPANFLFSHDGRIFAVVHGDALEREIVRASERLIGRSFQEVIEYEDRIIS